MGPGDQRRSNRHHRRRRRARATQAGLINDPFAEPLVRAVGVDFLTRWAAGELNGADVDSPDAPFGMQQMTDLMAARTRYFDAFFGDAVASGIRQAVILASGLDARGYRMQWPAGTVVFEIDQPAVLAFKSATLAELNASPAAEVRPVQIDLRHDWPAALRTSGSTLTGRQLGAPRACCHFCRRRRRIACSTTSPH